MKKRRIVRDGYGKRLAVARPAGKSSGGRKALRSYRVHYTHVMTAMVTDKNLAAKANRRATV